jgi:hypothetical protein
VKRDGRSFAAPAALDQSQPQRHRSPPTCDRHRSGTVEPNAVEAAALLDGDEQARTAPLMDPDEDPAAVDTQLREV